MGLLTISANVLIHVALQFFASHQAAPASVVNAVDSILVVIILLDIAHTVFGNLRSIVFPIRPFLVIGALAGVRDILSASAHLTISDSMSSSQFNHALVSLAIGVLLTLAMLLGLRMLKDHSDS